MELVVGHKTMRFKLLLALYIASDADSDYAINVKLLGEKRGMNDRKLRRSFKYLVEERFIEHRDGGSEFHAVISHKGIKVVEEVFLDPAKQTYYFPPYREMRTK